MGGGVHGPVLLFFFFLVKRECSGQLVRTLINPTGPEINDNINLQWPNMSNHKTRTCDSVLVLLSEDLKLYH